jgi:ADP-ribose pyrophosphatase YjhB (NUDIX family)
MSNIWKPSVTVAAIIERDGRFLLVEEATSDGIRLNQPAGHLDPSESLAAGCARETLEETAHAFTPTHLLGVYMFRQMRDDRPSRAPQDVTYLRFAFVGELGPHQSERSLDDGILRTLWLTPDEIRARSSEHRSPLVMKCIEDYLRGQRFPLEMLYTHPTVQAAST